MQLQSRPFTYLLLFVLTLGCVGAVFSTSGNVMFSPGDLHNTPRRHTPMGGVRAHAEISDCATCHVAAWSSESMADRCLGCHDNIKQQLDTAGPMHGRLDAGKECRSCHTEHRGPQAFITDLAKFDHAYAAFPLTGRHVEVECQGCHRDNLFRGTAQTCVSCHAEPQVHVGKFGTTCQVCHTTATWKGASIGPAGAVHFDHNSTGFPLTGKHSALDCQSCHKNNVFKGTAKSCLACHAEPKVHLGKFGTNCQECHGTATWKGAKLGPAALAHFDHSSTGFPLTGKHSSVDCQSCHKNNVFKGTAHTCVSCHAEPQVHLGKFGNECASCHSTTTWKGAVFAHKFPINHGNKRRTNTCATCHNANDYKTYTCYNCHEHEKTRIARKHREVRFRAGVSLEQCARCHANGKEKRRGELPDVEPRQWATIDRLLPMLDASTEGCTGCLSSAPLSFAEALTLARPTEPSRVLRPLAGAAELDAWSRWSSLHFTGQEPRPSAQRRSANDVPSTRTIRTPLRGGSPE